MKTGVIDPTKVRRHFYVFFWHLCCTIYTCVALSILWVLLHWKIFLVLSTFLRLHIEEFLNFLMSGSLSGCQNCDYRCLWSGFSSHDSWVCHHWHPKRGACHGWNGSWRWNGRNGWYGRYDVDWLWTVFETGDSYQLINLLKNCLTVSHPRAVCIARFIFIPRDPTPDLNLLNLFSCLRLVHVFMKFLCSESVCFTTH